MPIINRLSSLFLADFHALLDRLEDPYTTLSLAVREMEESLRDHKVALDSVKEEIELTARHCEQASQRLAALEEELDVCFKSNEEALAKAIIRRKLSAVKNLTELLTRREHLSEQKAKQQAALQEKERQLSMMREKLDLYQHEYENSHGRSENYGPSDLDISDEAVDIAFLKEQQRRAS